jgi:hypothetical protein
MVLDRVRILRTGIEVMLETRPVDPSDFRRGDCVRLSSEISDIPVVDLKGARFRKTIFATRHPMRRAFINLSPRAPSLRYPSRSVHPRERRPLYLLRGIRNGTSGVPRPHSSDLRIESSFVPPSEGRAIEQARNQCKAAIVALVTPAGRAAIKRLLLMASWFARIRCSDASPIRYLIVHCSGHIRRLRQTRFVLPR